MTTPENDTFEQDMAAFETELNAASDSFESEISRIHNEINKELFAADTALEAIVTDFEKAEPEIESASESQ